MALPLRSPSKTASRSNKSRRANGLSHQEAAQEDKQAQAPQSAQEDALAATAQVAPPRPGAGPVCGLDGYDRPISESPQTSRAGTGPAGEGGGRADPTRRRSLPRGVGG